MELVDFLRSMQSEIRAEIAERSVTPGEAFPFPHLIFTEVVSRHMADYGMTYDDPQVCSFTGAIGRGNGIAQLSGYALSEECDQLDLFVCIYEDADDVVSITDSETTKAAEQCLRFLTGCIEGNLAQSMDESHEAYGFVMTLRASYSQIDQIKVYVVTNGKVKTREFKSRVVGEKTIRLEVMDIQRLFNHMQDGKPRDELVVNFEEVSGSPLPCVWVPDEMGEYDYAMTVIPGETLRFIYEKYGSRILEANVRSFLSQTGKVNKGIANTLREQPERFMAYNNGIVIVADEARLGVTQDGGTGIAWLKGMQIVNGGQTTASLFFTRKKFPSTNLGKVRVPAKVIVLKETDQAKEEALIADISRYANSQNKVNESDLSANRPFHVEMEKLAMTTYCPDGITRWFYERAAGSYKVMLEREGKTPAGIRNLQQSIPISHKVTKTDLAKYLCAWNQRPDLVSLGGQKNFTAFMGMIDQEGSGFESVLNATEYKLIIAKVIIYKEAQRVIRKAFPAFQANITAYTIALFSLILADRLDFDAVWKKQTVSAALIDQILIWAKEVNDRLHTTARGRMISEWAKRGDCWEEIKAAKYSKTKYGVSELF